MAIHPSIEPALLAISKGLEGLQADLERAQSIQAITHSLQNLDQDPTSLTEEAVLIVQLAFLSILTLLLNQNQGLLKDLKITNKQVSILWTEHNRSNFTLGMNDRAFNKALHQANISLWNTENQSLNQHCLGLITNTLVQEESKLNRQIELAKKRELSLSRDTWKASASTEPESLLPLIAAMPIPSINEFYRRLQQELPEELTIQVNNTHTLNIPQFFQKDILDYSYLVEKINLHFTILFQSDGNSEVRDILNKKSPEILASMLSNPSIKEQTLAELKQSRSEIIETQLRLCQIFTRMLTPVLSNAQ